MDYVDYTLVRLGDESLRAALFDQPSLEQLAFAAYDAEAMLLGPPYSAVFDELYVGLSMPRRSTAEAAWGPSAGNDRRDGRVRFYGIGGDPAVRVDALWRGSVVAQAISPLARIERVIATWPDSSGIDDDIVRGLGALPADPKVLEAERRKRLLARLRSGFRQPEALSDAQFDKWLAAAGARDVGELMARRSSQPLSGALQLGFSTPPRDVPPAPRPLPLSAAILVRNQPLQIAQLLADSKLVRDQLDDLGVERKRDPDSMGRHPVLVVWMIPDSTFDDADWPGGENATTDDARRQLRRQVAGRWLAREGVGLVTTPAHAH